MATTVEGFGKLLYDNWAPVYADRYATLRNPGHPLLQMGSWDQEQYDRDYAEFLERFDTVEKLAEFADRINPPD